MSSQGQWHLRDHEPPILSDSGAGQIKPDHFYVALVPELARRMAAIAGSLDQVLAEVVDLLPAFMPCDSCLVYVLEGDELILRASKNPYPGVLSRVRLQAGQDLTEASAEYGQHISASSASASDSCRPFNRPSASRLESFLSVPILSKNKLVGLINLQGRTAHAYTAQEIDAVTTVACLVGGEIAMSHLRDENSRLTQRLETRKLVERAKGILQRELNLGEPEAHAMLQRQSQQMRKPIREIAEAILLSHAVKYPAN